MRVKAQFSITVTIISDYIFTCLEEPGCPLSKDAEHKDEFAHPVNFINLPLCFWHKLCLYARCASYSKFSDRTTESRTNSWMNVPCHSPVWPPFSFFCHHSVSTRGSYPEGLDPHGSGTLHNFSLSSKLNANSVSLKKKMFSSSFILNFPGFCKFYIGEQRASPGNKLHTLCAELPKSLTDT